MNEEQRNGESGEKPELSRNCKVESACCGPFTEGQADNEPSQGAVCISSSKDSRGMSRMGDGEKFSHFSLAVPFMMSVIFMDGRVPGRKEEGTRWGFLIRQ